MTRKNKSLPIVLLLLCVVGWLVGSRVRAARRGVRRLG